MNKKEKKQTRGAKSKLLFQRISEISMIFDIGVAAITLIGNSKFKNFSFTIDYATIQAAVNWGLTIIVVLGLISLSSFLIFNYYERKEREEMQ